MEKRPFADWQRFRKSCPALLDLFDGTFQMDLGGNRAPG